MFKKLKDYVLFQQRQWRRAKSAKRSQFSNPVINQINQKIDYQFQYQNKVNQEFLKQLQSLNQPKITPPKQPTPKRVVKPKVVKAKVHRSKPLPKGPKTNWQKEWARGMRLNRKFIDINVARELALAKDRKIAILEKQLKQERQEREALQKSFQVIKQNQEKQEKKIAILEKQLKQENQPGKIYNLTIEKLEESAKDAKIQEQATKIRELELFKKQVLAKPVQHRKKKNSFMHYGDDPNKELAILLKTVVTMGTPPKNLLGDQGIKYLTWVDRQKANKIYGVSVPTDHSYTVIKEFKDNYYKLSNDQLLEKLQNANIAVYQQNIDDLQKVADIYQKFVMNSFVTNRRYIAVEPDIGARRIIELVIPHQIASFYNAEIKHQFASHMADDENLTKIVNQEVMHDEQRNIFYGAVNGMVEKLNTLIDHYDNLQKTTTITSPEGGDYEDIEEITLIDDMSQWINNKLKRLTEQPKELRIASEEFIGILSEFKQIIDLLKQVEDDLMINKISGKEFDRKKRQIGLKLLRPFYRKYFNQFNYQDSKGKKRKSVEEIGIQLGISRSKRYQK